MTTDASASTLSDLDERQRYRRFDDLQRRMPDVWRAMRLNEQGKSVVVIPSVSLDKIGERSGSLIQAYEERFLFLLLLLRQTVSWSRRWPRMSWAMVRRQTLTR